MTTQASQTDVQHPRTVAVVTLGCARNEVDSEELAGRLADGGWTLVEDAADADVAVVNTCGFVEQAKKDSIDALLEASDLKESGRTQKVVAVGCLAERYGAELAEQLPEADAVLGFDSYTDMSSHLRAILAGSTPQAHTPGDRRRLLPLSPVARQQASETVALPGHGAGAAHHGADAVHHGVTQVPDLPEGLAPESGPRVVRRRLDGRPWAPLKIASGCDRRCAFCAIPAFRGSFVSRRPADVLAEARWLVDQGVREVFLVSENSTSYGKDLGDLRLLESLVESLGEVEGLPRIRVSYLQPAEIRPGLVEALLAVPTVVPYFDISFQHASEPVLRRMRRFGSTESFLALIEQVRAIRPDAGIRSNVIVGFPGETEADVAELERFLTAARLDVVGVFGYSDEDGTEGETLDDKIDPDVVAERVVRLQGLVDELMAQRAEERVGETVEVLVEQVPGEEDDEVVGRAGFQGPDVDGVTVLGWPEGSPLPRVGDLVTAVVVASEGVDLVAAPTGGGGR
ncbi:30S ribosomal protein S12 methylthiotransferase RimO [Arsenicicoccus sp. oral taxon 190]|uniref:30S ribosomal protein S12 methylthiotransferase RimO n=1 Tax=Arsenicicoccus sp. oral taxon 190 TaxID=1658671 RepID=UPI000679FB88|nr:30S ribosomal protein S12 methylthiotransferase RimO [Arsenicicoccus sp. oral taxon 190]AKT52206.1 ribosomal protein S12 methylthiotransferase [Arsenicicoccus sp. oral taxon 190]